MPAAIIPIGVKTIDEIVLCDDGSVSNCTHPAGHCFGSDGGSGSPENLKVAPGQGGEHEIWTVRGNTIDRKEIYDTCQYCGKMNYNRDV